MGDAERRPLIATREQLAPHLGGRVLHSRFYRWEPTGANVHIVEDLVPETAGTIIIPDTLRGDEKMGTGVVFACGHLVAEPGGYGYSPCLEPEQLLLQRVVFGKFSGKTIVPPYDAEFAEMVLNFTKLNTARVVVMTARDIIAVEREKE